MMLFLPVNLTYQMFWPIDVLPLFQITQRLVSLVYSLLWTLLGSVLEEKYRFGSESVLAIHILELIHAAWLLCQLVNVYILSAG